MIRLLRRWRICSQQWRIDVERIEQRATIDEVHHAGRRRSHADVISDCGTDFRVVGVCHRTELLDGKGPGEHDEAGLFQSCHRGKREGAGSRLHWWFAC